MYYRPQTTIITLQIEPKKNQETLAIMYTPGQSFPLLILKRCLLLKLPEKDHWLSSGFTGHWNISHRGISFSFTWGNSDSHWIQKGKLSFRERSGGSWTISSTIYPSEGLNARDWGEGGLQFSPSIWYQFLERTQSSHSDKRFPTLYSCTS